MCHILMFIILVHIGTFGKPESTRRPQIRPPNNPFEPKKPAEYSCLLPPYPENGSYLVVEDPDARPGDDYQQVTLVQYKTGERDQLVDINALACSYGEWFEILLQYQSEYRYFNSSVCASLCPEMWTEPPYISSTMRSAVTEKFEPNSKLCHIPENPPNVKYQVMGGSEEGYEAIYLSYSCTKRLTLSGNPYAYCVNGLWNGGPPKCITDPPPLEVNSGIITEAWQLDFVCVTPRQPKDGKYTVVNSPGTKAGVRISEVHLRYACHAGTRLVGSEDVYCVGGEWSGKSPTCVRCGLDYDVTRPSALPPWHAGVYDKRPGPHKHICGGTIIATNLIVSAAHCFWTDKTGLSSATRFAVAAGKAHRDWNDSRDGFTQKSEVNDIAIPPRYRGGLTNHQDDIALLFLSTPLDYNEYVAPVCVDFDAVLDERQTKPGNVGKIVLSKEVDDGSPDFQAKDLPYVDISECISSASPGSRAYMTSDKMCARVDNGTSLCTRDSGSGLALPAVDENNDVMTYYLRGVLVTVPSSDDRCDVSSLARFTDISAHAHFLKFYFDLAIW